MPTFFFMGKNDANVSKVSWKLWRLQRRNRTVIASWGRAIVVKRVVQPGGKLQSKIWTFRSENAAKAFEQVRTNEKIQEGYELSTRRGQRLRLALAGDKLPPTRLSRERKQSSDVELRAGTSRRGRAVRSDARVGTTERQIEVHFGLPPGSVKLVLSDGRDARSDKTINSFHRDWSA